MTCGVPQGSILGPLLCLCDLNDMPSSVQCKLLLYADDSALLVSDKDPAAVSKMLSTELESCRQWLIHLGSYTEVQSSPWTEQKCMENTDKWTPTRISSRPNPV